jgi:hypothetical protein
MFQLIGGLLAFFAIVAALASLPVAGAVFALATFLWVMIANPNRRTNVADDGTPWGATYERTNRVSNLSAQAGAGL